MADWSSLPSELVRHIADRFLSTNDLDCYMDFRAVCPPWRSATDDPKDSSELRFRPHRWIIIDEVFESESRLLVNTISGRVVRKDLPMLRRFYVVATTHGGFFVLADKEPPHAARILNHFTGHMILFIVSVPTNIDISAAALLGQPFPNLILLCDKFYMRYTAAADNEVFKADSDEHRYVLMRLFVASGVCANGQERIIVARTPAALPYMISAVMKLFGISPVTGLSDFVAEGPGNSCFLVKSASRLLAVVKLQHQFKVFNVTTYGDEPEPVMSIGDHAIFVGNRRCACVTANNFPSVVANCIYYVKTDDSSQKIYKYDLEDEKEEIVSEAIDSFGPVTAPITIVQLLSCYTMNVRVSQLPKEKLEVPDWYYAIHEGISDLNLDEDGTLWLKTIESRRIVLGRNHMFASSKFALSCAMWELICIAVLWNYTML